MRYSGKERNSMEIESKEHGKEIKKYNWPSKSLN
jgi:hypothetical protein